MSDNLRMNVDDDESVLFLAGMTKLLDDMREARAQRDKLVSAIMAALEHGIPYSTGYHLLARAVVEINGAELCPCGICVRHRTAIS